MEYYTGYKFVVAKAFTVQTAILGYDIEEGLAHLERDGKLTVRQWYAWDGNSGPCPDFKLTLEASCAHDVLCDFVNLGLLPQSLQPLVDQEYYRIAVKKGLWWRLSRLIMLVIRWYQTGKGAKRFHRKRYTA